MLRRGEPTLRAIVTCTLSISSDNPASRNQSAMSHRLSSTMANGPARAREQLQNGTKRYRADIIKCYDELIGLDAKTVGGHSLRAGFLTSGAARGASIFKMMDVSRHRSVDTLRDYVRDAENEVPTLPSGNDEINK